MNLNKDTILTELNKINDYSIPNESYSPFYSNIGLVIKEETEGAGTLFLHYNRNTRAVWQSLIDFPLKLNREKSLVNLLVFGDCDRTAQLAFFDTDAFLFEAKGMENIGLFRTPDATVLDHWTEDFSKKEVLVRGLFRNGDDRDPDTTVPFAVSIKMLKGSLIAEQGNITAKADENGTTRFAFVFKVLDVSADDMAGTMKKAPTDVNVAAEMCKEDILSCVKDLNIPHTSDPEREMIARALHGLLFNLAKAPGNLREHISSYPNRGRYPTHYLWDSCFQNLAYEEFSTELAEEFLMQLIKNQRSDGKIIHFLCSTWQRPHHSQPPLVGWAGLRLYQKTDSKEFLKTLFVSMEKNNTWWLTQRMTSYGILSCNDGLETGQDNSPRFDDGPTLACDMNSYLLKQLYITSELASLLGLPSKAEEWRTEAERLGKKMLEVLYNKEDNLFYDVNTATGKMIKMVTPCCLMPLWAGIDMDADLKKNMIEKYLIHSRYLFGDIPFPSVAYGEAKYEEDNWWRGSTWLSEAWIMLEILSEFGYEKEYETAVTRFYHMLLKDPHMHELFNSRTGEGLGSAEQGWTCAIFIKLCLIMRERNLLK